VIAALRWAAGDMKKKLSFLYGSLRGRTDRCNPVKAVFLSLSIETAVCHVVPDRITVTGYWT